MEEYDNNISIGSIPRQDDDAMNDIEIDQDDNDLIDDGSTGNLGNGAEDTESGLEKFKNKKRSEVWKICTELKVKEGEQRLAMCNICKKTFKLHSTSSTTQLGRHVKKCKAENGLLSQKVLQFTPSGTESNKLETFKYDHALMRKTVAEFTLINELPFSLVDSFMFNKMMSSATPFWQKITRQMVKQDCISFYEIEKAKLMDLLRLVDRVCITTDMWTSDHQKLGYMVVTGHWIDSSWSLHSRVLNFYNIPPPHSGLVISEELLICFREWDIQDKIGSITVDKCV